MQESLKSVVALHIPKVVVFSPESCSCCFQGEKRSAVVINW